MANKKESELKYLQMPIPQGQTAYKSTKITWQGYNKRQKTDTGMLFDEKNITTKEAPYLTPSSRPTLFYDGYFDESTVYGNKYPISMSAFDNFIIVFYRCCNRIENGASRNGVFVDYIKGKNHNYVYSKGIYGGDTTNKEKARSVVQFNLYDNPTDPISGKYIKKLVVFPDKKVLDFYVDDENKDTFVKSLEEDRIKSFGGDDDDVKASDSGEPPGNADKEYYWKNSKTGKVYVWSDNKYKYASVLPYPPKITVDEDTENNCVWLKILKPDKGDAGVCKFTLTTGGKTEEYEGIVFESTIKLKISKGTYYMITAQNGITDSDGNEVWSEYAEYAHTFNGSRGESGENKEETGSGWVETITAACPSLDYATVYQSRIFGVGNGRVYASGYNDYTNWALDTAGEYNENNAWVSPAQSNTKADGEFTGITTYQNHVICFKNDYMHEIYNTKNPFRIYDIFNDGCIDNRTIQEVDGKLFFVSGNDVKIYTGSNPKDIGYYLNISKITYAASGADGRFYHLYYENENEEGTWVTYDVMSEAWSERVPPSRILSFAANDNGMYILCADGVIYKTDTSDYRHEWSFETDMITNKTVDIKHIKRIQLLADVNKGGDMKIYLLYDDERFDPEKSHLIFDSKGKEGKLPIRVKPRMTAHYGVRLYAKGKGYVRIYELEMISEFGGDKLITG